MRSNCTMNIGSYDTDSFRPSLGFRLGCRMGDEGKYEPEFRLAWVHEFGDTDRDTTASFVNTATTFQLKGAEPDADSALVDLGANIFVKENMTLYVDYDGTLRSDYDAHALSGGFRYDF